jgi:hypothetical protein
VNSNWATVNATQDGNTVEAELVENAGNKYVLVKAVPDAGEVTIAAGNTPISLPEPAVPVFFYKIKNPRTYDLLGRLLPQKDYPSGIYLLYNGNGVTRTTVIK